MYGAQNKWCFVPNCGNTSIKSPNKRFLSIPHEYSRKVKWFEAVNRNPPKSKSTFFCCEDHFNLEEDMESYVRYKLMGEKKIKLKDGVVPHIFDCQDKKENESSPEQQVLLKKQRTRLVEEALSYWERKESNYFPSQFPSKAIHFEQSTVSGCKEGLKTVLEKAPGVALTRSVGIQVKPRFRSKYLTCKPSLRHTSTSTEKYLQ